MDHSQVRILELGHHIGFELIFAISLVGIVLWLFTRKVNVPISWSLLVAFAIAPHLARSSMGNYTGNAPFNEFVIRWLIYGIIFGGITWGFGKLYVDYANKGQEDDKDEYSRYEEEEWGDKTYAINNRFFVKAWQELEWSMENTGIWAKALSASNGDENKAKAIYIRLRVKQLASEA